MSTFRGWEKDRSKRRKLSRYGDGSVIDSWSNHKSPVFQEIKSMEYASEEQREAAIDLLGYDADYPYVAGHLKIEKYVDDGTSLYWVMAYYPENSNYSGDKYGEAEIGYETSYKKAFEMATNLIELIGENFSYADFGELNTSMTTTSRERFLQYKTVPEDYIFEI